MRAFCLALLALTGCFCSPPGPPPIDTCNDPSGVGVQSIDVGGALQAGDLGFHVLHDGDPVWVRRGGQGASMVVLKLRANGAAPSCLKEQTTITGADGVISTGQANVQADPDGAGNSVSHVLYFPGASWPDSVEISVEAAGQSVQRTVHPASLSSCGPNGPPCPCGQSRTCVQENVAPTTCVDAGSRSGALLLALLACERAACSGLDGGAPDAGAFTTCADPSAFSDCNDCVRYAEYDPSQCSATPHCGACFDAAQACASDY